MPSNKKGNSVQEQSQGAVGHYTDSVTQSYVAEAKQALLGSWCERLFLPWITGVTGKNGIKCDYSCFEWQK